MADQKYKGVVELEANGEKINLKFGITQQSINCELEGLKDDAEGIKECTERLSSGGPSSVVRFFYSAHKSYARLYKTPELSVDEFTALFEFVNPEDITKALGLAYLQPDDPNQAALQKEGQ